MPKSTYFMLSSIFFRKCLLLLILPSKIRLDIAPYSAPTSSAFVKIAEHRTTDTITKEAEKRGHWDAKTTRGLDITIDVQPNDEELFKSLKELNDSANMANADIDGRGQRGKISHVTHISETTQPLTIDEILLASILGCIGSILFVTGNILALKERNGKMRRFKKILALKGYQRHINEHRHIVRHISDWKD